MKKLTIKEYLLLGSMLFGMFFGAGNLIFPVYMGQLSGANSIPAIIGFCMIVLCILSTVLLLQTMGRIAGACINGTPYEGLILMLITLLVAHVFEWVYMLTR